MFNLDYTAKKLRIVYVSEGEISIEAKLNDIPIGIPGNTIEVGIPQQDKNNLHIQVTRSNREDVVSNIQIKEVTIDGKSYLDDFKKIKFIVDKNKHPFMQDTENNLFFGHYGSLDVDICHKVDILTRAKTVLINDPDVHIHGKETSNPDHRHVFTGCVPPFSSEILDHMAKSSDANDISVEQTRSSIEQWLSESSRINIKNLNMLENFTLSNGITQSIESVRHRLDDIFMPSKMYYLHGLLKGKNKRNIFAEELPLKAKVMFELPSPWYTTESILQKIKEAVEKRCHIILDLTWLPLSTKQIEIDASDISEIYFSMNKAWPVRDIRPAFRWSRFRINDSQTFDTEWNSFTKLPFNVFGKLIEKFSFDYTYNSYLKDADEICKTFDFGHTDVLWFKTHKDVKHTLPNHISEHYFLDDFVCIINLLQTKGKYFW